MSIEVIEVIEADEIFEDSILRFYDRRRRENNTLFLVEPLPMRHYMIYQVFFMNGKMVKSRAKYSRTQYDAIRDIFGRFANNQLGIELSMDIINKHQ